MLAISSDRGLLDCFTKHFDCSWYRVCNSAFATHCLFEPLNRNQNIILQVSG